MSKLFLSCQLRREVQRLSAQPGVVPSLGANPGSPTSSCLGGIDWSKHLAPPWVSLWRWLCGIMVQGDGGQHHCCTQTGRSKIRPEWPATWNGTSASSLTSLGLITLTLEWRAWPKPPQSPECCRSW